VPGAEAVQLASGESALVRRSAGEAVHDRVAGLFARSARAEVLVIDVAEMSLCAVPPALGQGLVAGAASGPAARKST
jgi:hypothetical protein